MKKENYYQFSKKSFVFIFLLSFLFLIANQSSSNKKFSFNDNSEFNDASIAVAELMSENSIDRKSVENLSETLRENIKTQTSLKVITRENMIRILEDSKNEQLLFCNNKDCFIQLGKVLKASLILTLNINKQDNNFIIKLQLFKINSSKIFISISKSRECKKEELNDFLGIAFSDLLSIFEEKIVTSTATLTPTPSPTEPFTVTPSPSPTIQLKPKWYKRWYSIALGTLAVGGAVIASQSKKSNSSIPTETPEPSATGTPSITPVFTLTSTPTPSLTTTPTIGCNSATNEAWISTSNGSMHFYMNCFESQNVFLAIPDTYLTWAQAVDECLNNQGMQKRLCTGQEWLLACKGRSGNNYPYGNEYDKDICFTEQPDHETAFPAGGKSGCVSEFGVFDLSGNVFEMSNEPVEGYPTYHYKFGGCWPNSNEYAGCYDKKVWADNTANIYTGYRCCRDPESPLNSTKRKEFSKRKLNLKKPQKKLIRKIPLKSFLIPIPPKKSDK